MVSLIAIGDFDMLKQMCWAIQYSQKTPIDPIAPIRHNANCPFGRESDVFFFCFFFGGGGGGGGVGTSLVERYSICFVESGAANFCSSAYFPFLRGLSMFRFLILNFID